MQIRRALITTFTWSYRFGLNAILNGLDYHDNDIEAHIIYGPTGVPLSYIEQAREIFPGTQFYNLNGLIKRYPPDPNRRGRWMLEFYKYKLAKELGLRGYNSVMIIDADYLILGNLEPHFNSVAGTDLITIGNCGPVYDHANEADPDKFAAKYADGNLRFIPMSCHPILFDASRNIDLLDYLWGIAPLYGTDGSVINRAIIETRRLEDVIVLPNSQWVGPIWGITNSFVHVMLNGKRCYVLWRDRIMMSHRRFWVYNDTLGQAAQMGTVELREPVAANMRLLIDECHLINTEWKLPLEYPVMRAFGENAE